MADQALSDALSQMVHEKTSCVSNITPMDVQLTSADTECAQALLDLARSFSSHQPVMPIQDQTRNQRNTVDSRSVLNPLSSNRSPPKRGTSLLSMKKTGVGRGSPGKRGRGRGGRYNHSFARMFDPVMASKLGCNSPESLKEEVIRRITLDHPYSAAPGSSNYPKTVDPAFYNLLEEVEGSGTNDSILNGSKYKGFSRKDPKQYIQNIVHQRKAEAAERNDIPIMKFYTERQEVSVNSARRSLDSLAQLLSSEITGQVKATEINPMNTGVKGSPVDGSAGQHGTNVSNPDLYQPYDDKYKNFNLLLKCLTNDSTEIKNLARKRSYSQNSADTGRKTIAQMTGTSQDVKCLHCMKVFSNGIYLRKHSLRAHPTAFYQETVRPETISCSNCSLNVEKQKLDQHLALCTKKQVECNQQNADIQSILSANKHSSNNATCQFCGVRMRRQMLVKHLANKHCIENKDQGNLENDGTLSDSGSSTLSGTSDVENKCFSNSDSGNENIIQCDICFAFVPKPMLSQHVADQHFNMVSGTGYTAGFQNGSVKEEVDSKSLKSETISDALSYSNNIPSKSTNSVHNGITTNSKSASPPSSGTFKQYMLHRFLSENPGSVPPEGVTEPFNSQTCRLSSPNNVASIIDSSVSSGFGPENSIPDNSGGMHGSGSYTVVVRSETSSLHDTINALAERISPQMQV